MSRLALRPALRMAARGGAQRAGASPSYWLAFDGTNDKITLPTGEGQEPTTGIFCEAWVLLAAEEGTNRGIVEAGGAYNQGYSLSFTPRNDTHKWRVRFYLAGPANSGIFDTGTAITIDGIPVHVAAGWDGSFIYVFLDGVLVVKQASDNTPISYTGTTWTIGDGTWIGKHSYSLVRVSNTCRHTATFTPPFTALTPDANTVFLANCQEGAGTALTDAGPGAHHGTFLGAGEPAWGAAVDLSATALAPLGRQLWTDCQAMIPTITDTNVYLHRTSADAYEVYWKVHATGPTWVRQDYVRQAGSALFAEQVFVGVPDPANDDPTSWTTGPATQLTPGTGISSNEYAIAGTPLGEAASQFGANHGNETLDSEQWYVDDVATNLADDTWANGAVVRYHTTSSFAVGATDVADVVRDTYFDRATNYVRHVIGITWAIQVDLSAGFAYSGMFNADKTVFTRGTFESGGTDYDITGVSTSERVKSLSYALWNPATEYVVAGYVPDPATVFYFPPGSALTHIVSDISRAKAYFPMHTGIIVAGDVWNLETYTRVFANCGNHFLKTT